MSSSFENVLRSYTQQNGFTYTPAVLSRLSGISKATIINWLNGEVARPRYWQDIVKVANVLRLDATATDALLAAADYPSLAMLYQQVAHEQDVALLAPWLPTRQPAFAWLHSLPTPASPIVGRSDERATLGALLQRQDVRLITLVGAGGTGKTRLALQIASDARETFGDAVCFVGLGSLTEPKLVAPTIASVLGLSPSVGEPLPKLLASALASRPLLLVLDNFEHLLAAAPLLAELLSTAPALKLLVTSRVVLNLYDEYGFQVHPLPLPNLQRLPPIEQLMRYPAVELFVLRARALRPDFRLTPANAALVAAICVRADGLPLAIELAATRIRSLSPQRLLGRLDQRLTLLSDGSKRLPTRQQTLRATLEWSYNLLDNRAQMVFARLAVFMGGWTTAGATAVCHLDQGRQLLGLQQVLPRTLRSPDVLDTLMALADSSLIGRSESVDGASRFTMLETVREFAGECLTMIDDEQATRRRHAAYYLALAEEAEPKLVGPEQILWLTQLDQEHDNIRAALRWVLAQGQGEQACRFGGALWRFWFIRGHLVEGRRWLEEALAQRDVAPKPIQAKALLAAGRLARQQADLACAQFYLEAALELERAHGTISNVAFILGSLGVVAYDQGDFARARLLHEQSLVLRRMVGDDWGIAATLTNLGEVARQQGDEQRAEMLHEESLALSRDIGDLAGIAAALLNLGLVVRNHGDVERAMVLLEESLLLSQQLGEKVEIAECLEGLAGLAAAQGQAVRAARLAGAAEIVRQTAHAPLSPADQARYERYLAPARAQLDAETFLAAWIEGRALSLDQAVAYALSLEYVG
jgi:predicted ATPase/transcriptional regulator with XRE-family HTH domain